MQKDINILLVDDETDFLEITAKRLTRSGYSVSTALSCQQGLEAIKNSDVDVVVLDVMLPDLNGIQCLKEMKKHDPELVVIILTGHASIEAGLRSLEYGASDYCLKPVEYEELVEKIKIAHRDVADDD